MAPSSLTRWLVGAATGVALIGLVGAFCLALTHGGSVLWTVVWTLPAMGTVSVGAVLCARVCGNPIGWVFLGVGTVLAVGLCCDAFALARPGAGAAPAADVVGYLFESVPVVVLPTVLLLFPEGRLPSRRWRPVGVVWIVVTVAILLNALLAPDLLVLDSNASVQNPIGLGGVAGAIVSNLLILVLVFVVVMVAAAVSLVLRYRQATGDLRQQLKWFGAGGVLVAIAAVLIPITGNMGPPWGTVVLDSFWSLAMTGLVVTTGVAILRYRLYEIDVIIRRTLVYTALIGSLAVAYLCGIYLIDRALQAVTGQSSALAVTLSTLAVVVIFQPLRTRIRAAVDRRFYRQKYDTARTLDAFTGRLREQVDLDAIRVDVLEVIRATVQPTHASIVMRRSPVVPESRSNGP